MGWIREFYPTNHEEFFVSYRSNYTEFFLHIWSNNFTEAYMGKWQHWKITVKNDQISWYWNETLLISTSRGPLFTGALQTEFAAIGSHALHNGIWTYNGAIADFDDIKGEVALLPNLILEATPDPGKYFWNWNINNTRLGLSYNSTSNPLPLIVDHDYNVTAYFADEPMPVPPTTFYLYIVIIGNGTTTPTPGLHAYSNGTVVTLTATAGADCYFSVWAVMHSGWLDRYSTPSIQLTMNETYDVTAAFWHKTKVYFAVKYLSTYITSYVTIYAHKITAFPLPLTVEGNYLTSYLASSSYDFLIQCPGYYDKWIYGVTISGTQQTVDVSLVQIQYTIPGAYILPYSQTATFYATLPYSNETQYADLDHYIRIQVVPGTNGTLKMVLHYGTTYPIIEIDAENITLVEFDLETLYQHYCLTSYKTMQQSGLFTGLKIATNTDMQINLEMPDALDFWHRPTELLKITDSTVTSFNNYQCIGNNLTLNFSPGDPTISMLFHAEPDQMTLVFWNLIPFIFVMGSLTLFTGSVLEIKKRNFKEFIFLAIFAIVLVLLIPIIPAIMA
jgi:hypothetical protein